MSQSGLFDDEPISLEEARRQYLEECRRAHKVAENVHVWAEENGYEILSSEHRLTGGRFWWRKSKGQEVYYITIKTSEGQTRRGWVRCGGWFLGVFSNQADVEWDE